MFNDILLLSNLSETLTKNETLHYRRLITMKDLQKSKRQQLHVATTGGETVSSEIIGLYLSQPYRGIGRPLSWMQQNSSDSYFQGAIKANKFVPIKTSTGGEGDSTCLK